MRKCQKKKTLRIEQSSKKINSREKLFVIKMLENCIFHFSSFESFKRHWERDMRAFFFYIFNQSLCPREDVTQGQFLSE